MHGGHLQQPDGGGDAERAGRGLRSLPPRRERTGVAALVGREMDPKSIVALEELGVYSEAHRARNVERAMVEAADLVLAMGPRHVARIERFFGTVLRRFAREGPRLARFRRRSPSVGGGAGSLRPRHDRSPCHGAPTSGVRRAPPGVSLWIEAAENASGARLLPITRAKAAPAASGTLSGGSPPMASPVGPEASASMRRCRRSRSCVLAHQPRVGAACALCGRIVLDGVGFAPARRWYTTGRGSDSTPSYISYAMHAPRCKGAKHLAPWCVLLSSTRPYLHALRVPFVRGSRTMAFRLSLTPDICSRR